MHVARELQSHTHNLLESTQLQFAADVALAPRDLKPGTLGSSSTIPIQRTYCRLIGLIDELLLSRYGFFGSDPNRLSCGGRAGRVSWFLLPVLPPDVLPRRDE